MRTDRYAGLYPFTNAMCEWLAKMLKMMHNKIFRAWEPSLISYLNRYMTVRMDEKRTTTELFYEYFQHNIAPIMQP